MTFLEGYLWGPERPRAAMLEAARIAHSAGRTVAFTLSESLCIGDRREGVLGHDRSAARSTSCSATRMRCATYRLRRPRRLRSTRCPAKVGTLVVTRGADGRIAVEGGERVEIAAAPVTKVVDTTGAGDLFAAGFLAARCRGRDARRPASRPARSRAAEVISHFGARPEADLRELGGL